MLPLTSKETGDGFGDGAPWQITPEGAQGEPAPVDQAASPHLDKGYRVAGRRSARALPSGGRGTYSPCLGRAGD